MPRVGVAGCAIARYGPTDPEQAALIAAWFGGTSFAAGAVPRRFPAHELLPRELLPEDQVSRLVVEPLLDQEEPLGFAVFQLSAVEGHVYELMQKVLGAALRVCLSSEEKGAAAPV